MAIYNIIYGSFYLDIACDHLNIYNPSNHILLVYLITLYIKRLIDL